MLIPWAPILMSAGPGTSVVQIEQWPVHQNRWLPRPSGWLSSPTQGFRYASNSLVDKSTLWPSCPYARYIYILNSIRFTLSAETLICP